MQEIYILYLPKATPRRNPMPGSEKPVVAV